MTRAACNAGTCPCARPERPPEGHECPPDERSFAEIEEERERQLNRPYELDEGLTAQNQWP